MVKRKRGHLCSGRQRKYPKSDAPGVELHLYVAPFPSPSNRLFDHPTNKQMAELIACAYPLDDKLTIVNSVSEKHSMVMKKLIQHTSRVPDHLKLGKTPISWLEDAVRRTGREASIYRVDRSLLVSGSSRAYIIYGELSSNSTKGRRWTSSEHLGCVPVVGCTNRNHTEHRQKWWAIVLPHAGVFYLCNHKSNGKQMTTLPISWLRLHCRTGCPSNGGFFWHIDSVWAMDTSNDSIGRQQIRCYQFDDYEDGVPLLPPDYYCGCNVASDRKSRELYRKLMKSQHPSSESFRKGCRRYIKGSQHKRIPDSCLVLDQRVVGDFDLQVVCRSSNGSAREISRVQCTSIFEKKRTMSLLKKGARRVKDVTGNCRRLNLDHGHMYGLGEMICGGQGKKLRETNITKELDAGGLLSDICVSVKEELIDRLSTVIPAMERAERECGRTVPVHLGGEDGITSSMNLSNGLANASHYDVGDGSVGFSVWVELIRGASTNWFFVMPNVLVRYEGVTYQGLAIQLFSGCTIAWDGRIIRHATTITEFGEPSNSTFGWFWSADRRAMAQQVHDLS